MKKLASHGTDIFGGAFAAEVSHFAQIAGEVSYFSLPALRQRLRASSCRQRNRGIVLLVAPWHAQMSCFSLPLYSSCVARPR